MDLQTRYQSYNTRSSSKHCDQVLQYPWDVQRPDPLLRRLLGSWTESLWARSPPGIGSYLDHHRSISHFLTDAQCPMYRYAIGQYVDQSGDVISHLNISSAGAEDGGLYACVAANTLATVEHKARLNIYGNSNRNLDYVVPRNVDYNSNRWI